MGIGFQNQYAGFALLYVAFVGKPSQMIELFYGSGGFLLGGVMASAENEEMRENKEINWMWGGLMAAVILIWAGMGYYANSQGAERGTFGDMFGAVNALFTGLAFAGIIMTISLQMKELKLQRLELRETRRELEGQKLQLASQASTLKQQAADANFFRMLEMFRHMAQNIQHPGGVPQEDTHISGNYVDLSGANQRFIGTEYWRFLAKVCRHEMRGPAVVLYGADMTPEQAAEHWITIYRRWDTSLGPYFSTLVELLNLLAEAEDATARRWARILRAQLGLQEMLPIYFHGLTAVGQQRLRPYIEKFGIFTHFSDDPVYQRLAPRQWYGAGAFLPQGTT